MLSTIKSYIQRIESKDPTLTRVVINYSKLSLAELKAITTKLVNSKVTELDLSYTNIDCEGIKVLAELLEKNTLTYLALNGNQLGDEELKILATAVKRNNSLTGFSILANRASREGKRSLAEAFEGHKNLISYSGFGEFDIGRRAAKNRKNTLIVVDALLQESTTINSTQLEKLTSGSFAAIATILKKERAFNNEQITNLFKKKGITKLIEKLQETDVIIEEGIEKERLLNKAIKEQKQIIKDVEHRPLNMKNGDFGHLARELAYKTGTLNDAVIDWGYHWSCMKPAEEPEEAKQGLKELITDILDVYKNSPDHEDGRVVHNLRKNLTEETLDSLVSDLYDSLTQNEERIYKQGPTEDKLSSIKAIKENAEETIKYLHGGDVSASFLLRMQREKVKQEQLLER